MYDNSTNLEGRGEGIYCKVPYSICEEYCITWRQTDKLRVSAMSPKTMTKEIKSYS